MDGSTKIADLAPRDKASKPRAPVPENKSATTLLENPPFKFESKILKMDSRILSEVGRIEDPTGINSFRPLFLPLIIRTSVTFFLVSYRICLAVKPIRFLCVC